MPISERFGLINTMVFTHLPANICLILVPFAPIKFQKVQPPEEISHPVH